MSDCPLVSAIMPTRGRQAFARRALDCWYAQTWPNKELIILDDKEDKSFNRTEALYGGARYFTVPGRLTIGEKRNRCIRESSGDYIVHFDSDDWSSPNRITDQMARIVASRKSVTGYHSLLFTNSQAWWQYEGQVFSGLPKGYLGVFGTSLLYRRNWWKQHLFVDGPKQFENHEDKAFVQAAIAEGELLEVPAGDHMYAQVHSGNSSPKGTADPVRWKPVTDLAIIGPLLLAQI